MSIRDLDPQSFPDIRHTATQLEPEFEATPFEGIILLRVTQVMDASPMGLGMSEDDLTVWGHARAMVEAAYRLGLRDGLVKLGELA
ncbi:hypothetical protein DAETH_28880 [Deinococcus aetherius]|uniref:Uncharacterized protein n=1 Tax=Deinococcus aetherius TaxID=200252 RepID=A0ABM8AGT7_9DEIO|nr:hypothetical protein [Deinococcus aetherius]BDP42919.1 hypothetical protein DAETH_28880 [Deinococcus aetherius]